MERWKKIKTINPSVHSSKFVFDSLTRK